MANMLSFLVLAYVPTMVAQTATELVAGETFPPNEDAAGTVGGLWDRVSVGSIPYKALSENVDSRILFDATDMTLGLEPKRMSRRLDGALRKLADTILADPVLKLYKLRVIRSFVGKPDPLLPAASLHYDGRQSLIALSPNPDAAATRLFVDYCTSGIFDFVYWPKADENLVKLEVAMLNDICKSKVDLAFLLDSSESMTTAEFGQSLDFAVSITNYFELGVDAMQVAMVSFSGYSDKMHRVGNVASGAPECPLGTYYKFVNDAFGAYCLCKATISGCDLGNKGVRNDCINFTTYNVAGQQCEDSCDNNCVITTSVYGFKSTCSTCTCSVYNHGPDADLRFNFDAMKSTNTDEQNHQLIDSLILATPHRAGYTHTSAGIEYVNEHVFVTANGSRAGDADVQKVLVVITDGQSTAGYDPSVAAAKLRTEKGVSVYAMGIIRPAEVACALEKGKQDPRFVIKSELTTIAGADHEGQIFELDSYSDLARFSARLLKAVCDPCAVSEMPLVTNGELAFGERKCYKLSCAYAKSKPAVITIRVPKGTVHVYAASYSDPGPLQHELKSVGGGTERQIIITSIPADGTIFVTVHAVEQTKNTFELAVYSTELLLRPATVVRTSDTLIDVASAGASLSKPLDFVEPGPGGRSVAIDDVLPASARSFFVVDSVTGEIKVASQQSVPKGTYNISLKVTASQFPCITAVPWVQINIVDSLPPPPFNISISLCPERDGGACADLPCSPTTKGPICVCPDGGVFNASDKGGSCDNTNTSVCDHDVCFKDLGGGAAAHDGAGCVPSTTSTTHFTCDCGTPTTTTPSELINTTNCSPQPPAISICAANDVGACGTDTCFPSTQGAACDCGDGTVVLVSDADAVGAGVTKSCDDPDAPKKTPCSLQPCAGDGVCVASTDWKSVESYTCLCPPATTPLDKHCRSTSGPAVTLSPVTSSPTTAPQAGFFVPPAIGICADTDSFCASDTCYPDTGGCLCGGASCSDKCDSEGCFCNSQCPDCNPNVSGLVLKLITANNTFKVKCVPDMPVINASGLQLSGAVPAGTIAGYINATLLVKNFPDLAANYPPNGGVTFSIVSELLGTSAAGSRNARSTSFTVTTTPVYISGSTGSSLYLGTVTASRAITADEFPITLSIKAINRDVNGTSSTDSNTTTMSITAAVVETSIGGDDDGPAVWLIVIIVVVLLLCCALAMLYFCCCKKKKEKEKMDNLQDELPAMMNNPIYNSERKKTGDAAYSDPGYNNMEYKNADYSESGGGEDDNIYDGPEFGKEDGYGQCKDAGSDKKKKNGKKSKKDTSKYQVPKDEGDASYLEARGDTLTKGRVYDTAKGDTVSRGAVYDQAKGNTTSKGAVYDTANPMDSSYLDVAASTPDYDTAQPMMSRGATYEIGVGKPKPTPQPEYESTTYRDVAPTEAVYDSATYKDVAPTPVDYETATYRDVAPTPVDYETATYRDVAPTPVDYDTAAYKDVAPQPVAYESASYTDVAPTPVEYSTATYRDVVPNPAVYDTASYTDVMPGPKATKRNKPTVYDHTNNNKPTARANNNKPTARADNNKPTARADNNKPTARADNNKPTTQIYDRANSNKPTAQVYERASNNPLVKPMKNNKQSKTPDRQSVSNYAKVKSFSEVGTTESQVDYDTPTTFSKPKQLSAAVEYDTAQSFKPEQPSYDTAVQFRQAQPPNGDYEETTWYADEGVVKQQTTQTERPQYSTAAGDVNYDTAYVIGDEAVYDTATNQGLSKANNKKQHPHVTLEYQEAAGYKDVDSSAPVYDTATTTTTPSQSKQSKSGYYDAKPKKKKATTVHYLASDSVYNEANLDTTVPTVYDAASPITNPSMYDTATPILTPSVYDSADSSTDPDVGMANYDTASNYREGTAKQNPTLRAQHYDVASQQQIPKSKSSKNAADDYLFIEGDQSHT